MKLVALAVIVVLALAPGAAAQDFTGPAERHAGKKASQATTSPTGFVQDHATEEGVVREAEWGVAYGCYVVAESHDEFGTPDPELEQCEDYEEALGIEPDNKTEEPVGDANNLTEEPVGEAEELAEDALDSVDRIVDDPKSAPEEALKLVGRALGFALWLVAYALGIVEGASEALKAAAAGLVGGLFEATDTLGVAASTASSVPIGTWQKMGALLSALGSGVSSSGADIGDMLDQMGEDFGTLMGDIGDGIADLFGSITDGLGDAGSAVGKGLGDAGDAIGDGFGAMGTGISEAASAVGDFLGGLFGGSGEPGGDEPLDDGDLTDAPDRLLEGLPCVECILGA